MDATSQTQGTLRISAPDLVARRQAGEPMTLIDVRAARAWDSSPEKLPGAVRADGHDFHIDPSWPKNRLTVAY